MSRVTVSGAFDDLRSHHIRLLEEASRSGDVQVALWTDEVIRDMGAAEIRFPEAERAYLVDALRYVDEVVLSADHVDPDTLPSGIADSTDIWCFPEKEDYQRKREFCVQHGIEPKIVLNVDLAEVPAIDTARSSGETGRKKVIVTGCFDWLHSGHVRFFEKAAEYGELYVSIGSDTTIEEYKGENHPMFPQDIRFYMVDSIRFVHETVIGSGSGWLDATPEIEVIRPDYFVVNEDGDRPEKRTFCDDHDIEYVVLERTPKEGLPRRISTILRGY